MRDDNQILAEVFDSLIKREDGKIPPEVGDLVSIGLRLYNECPNADPGFLAKLGERLQAEWATARPSSPRRPVLARLLPATRAQRAIAVVALTVVLVSVSLFATAGLRSTVSAGLGRVISLLRGVVLQKVELPEGTPPPTPTERQEFRSAGEALAAAGPGTRLPPYLPRGYEFDHATVEVFEGQRCLTLVYIFKGDASYDSSMGVSVLGVQEYLAAATSAQSPFSIPVPPGSVERLKVAGLPALYAKGYIYAGRWERTGHDRTLLVQGRDLLVQVSGPCSRDEMIRVAESLFR